MRATNGLVLRSVDKAALLRQLLCTALSVLALHSSAVAQQQSSAAVPVGVVKAERRLIAQSGEFVGRVEAISRVEIRARITGFLGEVLFKEGDLIKEGAPLYRIAPLQNLIAKYVDATLVARIAEESRRGRALVIITTNLDAGVPVIWNIGAIAESGRPEAIGLIRKILLASASIPGLFPPVMRVDHFAPKDLDRFTNVTKR